MSKQNKKIELKNYIILLVIVLVTIFAVFYMRNFYIMSKVYYTENSVMLDVIKEVSQDELQNYLVENPKIVLYVSPKQNPDIKKFEKTFKNLVIKEELEDNILYLDSDTIDNIKLKKSLKVSADKNIKNKIDTDSVVTMYIIENGKVTNIITDAEKKSKGDLKKSLQKYGVIENA